ncbi:MAG TPA: helix-turn-helix domain-containing protein [Candidatus Dormibacteraeota bacterium]|jgi:AcrR family transcriptional regulator|nr:helix-turn-helix domain-containing protein [Candidatus Dormibacteraeota bacterium]
MDIITPEPASQEPATPRGGEQTRRRLVESALDVFAERGYHAATLSEIAARAGLTTGAVYSTFGSKKALLIAACTQGAGDDGEVGGLAQAGSLREALEGLVLDRARTGLNPATLRLLRLQVELLKLGLREPEVLAAMSSSGDQQLDAVAAAIDALAARDGVALPMPGRELAVLLSAMLNGLGLIQLVDPSVVPEELFLRGLHALMGWQESETATTRRPRARPSARSTPRRPRGRPR